MRIEKWCHMPLVLAVFVLAVVGCADSYSGEGESTPLLGLASATASGPGMGAASDNGLDGFTVASGDADEHPAARTIREMGEEALAIFADTGLTEDARFARFRAMMARGIDVEPIGRFVLGRYWRKATSEQREAYLAVYADFIVTSFSRKLGGVSISRFDVLGVQPTGPTEHLVETLVERDRGDPIKAIWRVRERDGSHRIVDLMVEGISLAVTQRQEFSSVIRGSGGIDGLIARLKQITAALA